MQFIKAPPELIFLVLPEMIVSVLSIVTGQVTSLLGCLRLSRDESMWKMSLFYIRFDDNLTNRDHILSVSLAMKLSVTRWISC